MLATALLLALTFSVTAQLSQTFVSSGSFIIPAGVTNIKVECWGGGGAGGQASTSSNGKGGGGGGAYASSNLPVTSGNTFTVTVGAGGIAGTTSGSTSGGQSSFGILVIALGGTNGDNATNSGTGGAGGLASGSIGTTKSSGGNGGNGRATPTDGGGGGGGSSATASGVGVIGANYAGGNGGAGGNGVNGDGGNGGRDYNSGLNGTAPGGGGGGRGDYGPFSGNGGSGQVIITWTQPVGYCPGNALPFTQNSVNHPDRAIGISDNRGAQMNQSGDQLALDLINNGKLLTAGGFVSVTWRRTSNLNPIITVAVSETGAIPWVTSGTYNTIGTRNTWITQVIPLPINARFIRFTTGNNAHIEIDAISFNTACALPCVIPTQFIVSGGGCFGGTELPVQLSDSEIGVKYQLFLGATPQGAALDGTGSLLDFGKPAVAGTYTVVSTRTLGGCTSTMNGNAIVSVNAAPAQPSPITGIKSPCIGSSQTYNVTNVPGVIYDWTLPAADWIQTGGGNSNSIVVTVGPTPGNIKVTPRTACNFGTSQQMPVTPITATALTPSISANYCFGGGNILLSANGGGAGDTYLWNTGESTKDILVNVADQFSVTMTSAAGCLGSATYSTATELIVNGDFTAGNTGFTSAYTFIPPASGALVPGNNFTIDVDPNISHIDFWGQDHTTNDGNFMIVNGNGLPTVWTQTVNVIPNTVYKFSAWAISLNDEPLNSNLSFSIDGVEQPASRTGVLPTGAITNAGPFDWVQFEGTWNSGAKTGLTDVSIVVIAQGAAASGFGLDDISFATLTPVPTVIAPTSNASALCEGEQLELSANLTGGKAPYSYSWTGPDGSVLSTLENPVIPIVAVANSGNYTLSVTDGFGCDVVTAYTSVTVTPTVTIDAFSPSTSTRCQGAGSATYATTASATGITYSLDAASTTGGNSIVATTGIVTYVAGWSGTSIITASVAGCNGTSTTNHTVTVIPTVGTPVFALGASSARDQGVVPVTYTATATGTNGITYSLDAASIAGGNTIDALTGKVTYVALWSWKSIITATAAGCNGPKTADHVVGVNWCYALFTANGALSCAGASVIKGNVGTFVGATSGFTGPPVGTLVFPGHIDAEASAASAQAAAQAVSVYNDLATIPCTDNHPLPEITLAGPKTLTPNVFCYGGALTISGEITLDGLGNPNAVFIFKINGALTTNTLSKIKLAGLASFRNVYWRVYGAVVLSGDEFKGTIVNEGAFTVNSGAALEGRALSINGAIAITDNAITSDCYPLFTEIDNSKPIFVPPTDIIGCVENLTSAVFDPLTIDINRNRPDYYTYSDTDTRLDLNTALFTDDEPLTCPSNIRWEIDFSPASDFNPPYNLVTQPLITGIGQPSAHIGNILFPGDGVNFNPVVHHITWWIKDCAGNESPPQTRTITINPRPKIVKIPL
jgi:hypothetical protein